MIGSYLEGCFFVRMSNYYDGYGRQEQATVLARYLTILPASMEVSWQKLKRIADTRFSMI
ncbi:hypothetical protein LPIBR_200011 [Lacticaseibacillus paracasei]|nr:hypothetical protein LPIBR_200011 [Lacticaseibacillus paracasei]